MADDSVPFTTNLKFYPVKSHFPNKQTHVVIITYKNFNQFEFMVLNTLAVIIIIHMLLIHQENR